MKIIGKSSNIKNKSKDKLEPVLLDRYKWLFLSSPLHMWLLNYPKLVLCKCNYFYTHQFHIFVILTSTLARIQYNPLHIYFVPIFYVHTDTYHLSIFALNYICLTSNLHLKLYDICFTYNFDLLNPVIWSNTFTFPSFALFGTQLNLN